MPKEKKPEQSPMAAKIEKVDVGTKGKIDESLKAQFLSDHVNDRNVRFANMGNKPVFACASCGKEIGESNGVKAPRNVFLSGYHPVCLPCQQRYYEETAAKTSRTYALFYCCHAYNVPYKPDVMGTMAANQNGVWYEYIKRLQIEQEPGVYGAVVETWKDGLTDIAEAFSGEFPVLPITGDVLVANMHEMSNRERWNIEWGEKMIAHYKKYGADPKTKLLLFSDGLDFANAEDLHRYFSGRTRVSFGIGTFVSNDTDVDPLNIVIKLQYVNGRPVAKLSDSPGKTMTQDQEYLQYLEGAVRFRLQRER